MIDPAELFAHVVRLGIERFYRAVETVEGKSNVIITIAIDTQSLWWNHGSPPHVVVSHGPNAVRVYLLWSYGQMVAAISQVTT